MPPSRTYSSISKRRKGENNVCLSKSRKSSSMDDLDLVVTTTQNTIKKSKCEPALQGKNLKNFEMVMEENMSLEDQLEMMYRHLQKHDSKHAKEAEKYYNKLLKEIKLLKSTRTAQNEQYVEIENLKTQIENQQLEQENLQTQIENQKQIHEDTLKAINTEMDNLITENQDLKHLMQEKDSKLQFNTKADLERDLQEMSMEEMKTQCHQLRLSYQKLQMEVEIKNEIFQQHNQTLNTMRKLYEELSNKLGILCRNQEQLKTTTQNEPNLERAKDLRNNSTYASKISAPVPLYSKSALLLTRKLNTKLTMFGIREELNKAINIKANKIKIFSTLAKDKNTIVIRSETEEDIDRLSDLLQANEKITSLVTLKYAAEKRKKIIILGIPKSVTVMEVKQKISENLDEDVTDNQHKEFNRDKLKSYQLMLDLEDSSAIKLLRQGRLLVGFISCPIKPYSPIIRCNNCQYYGHTAGTCRKNTICAYCAKKHESEYCPLKDEITKHTCINCLNSYDQNGCPYEKNHAANSTYCQVFQNIYHQRNLTINKNSSRSRP